MQKLNVKVLMTHPTTNYPTEMVTRLRVTDEASGKVMIEVEMTLQDFHDLMAGRLTARTCEAEALEEGDYRNVGMKRHRFERSFEIHGPQGQHLDLIRQWAADVATEHGLDEPSVRTHPGRIRVSWTLHSRTMDDQLHQLMVAKLDNIPSPLETT